MQSLFDEPVKLFSLRNAPGVSQAGPITEERHIRIAEKKRSEESQCFVVDVYDRRDPLFIFRGSFTRVQFDEIRKVQRLKYNFENAAREIITSIRDTRKTTDEVIQLVIEEAKCRLELVHKTKHSDFVTLYLDLKRLSGNELIEHLLGIIQTQKQKFDAYAGAMNQCAQLSEELSRVRREYDEKLAALQEEYDCLERDANKKDEEIEKYIRSVDQLQADQRNLQAAYDSEQERMEVLDSDNEELVRALDDYDLQIGRLKVENTRLKDQFAALHKQYDYADKKLQNVEQKYGVLKRTHERLQESLAAKTRETTETEEQLKNEMEELRRKYESLRTHEGLLEAQLKDLGEKMAAKENFEKTKNDRINKRIFKTTSNVA